MVADTPPRPTCLESLHQRHGAKLVDFAGFRLPLHYEAGIVAEHLHTRAHCSLFDVSHMGQVEILGSGAAAALERLTPADLVGLAPGRQRYAVLTNPAGGIIDDVIVARAGAALHVVINAANRDEVFAYLRDELSGLEIHLQDDRPLLALQGPDAASVLEPLVPGAGRLRFMQWGTCDFGGAPLRVARGGYTGEDGFELSLPAVHAEALATALLEDARCAPAGLGARDSLRLEAGLCLYGHELTADTTPVEADLAWTVGRARRAAGERPGGFPGADVLAAQLADGAARQRVGLQPAGRAPLRAGTTLVDATGAGVGAITSGGFSPTLDRLIAMGYVATACAPPGTALTAELRGRAVDVTVVKLPFVPHNYRT